MTSFNKPYVLEFLFQSKAMPWFEECSQFMSPSGFCITQEVLEFYKYFLKYIEVIRSIVMALARQALYWQSESRWQTWPGLNLWRTHPRPTWSWSQAANPGIDLQSWIVLLVDDWATLNSNLVWSSSGILFVLLTVRYIKICLLGLNQIEILYVFTSWSDLFTVNIPKLKFEVTLLFLLQKYIIIVPLRSTQRTEAQTLRSFFYKRTQKQRTQHNTTQHCNPTTRK